MNCHEAGELLGAYFDNELDPANSAAMQKHLAECGGCAAALERQQALRAAIRSQARYYTAPPELLSRLRAPSPRRSFLPQFALAAAALLAGIVVARIAWTPAGPSIEGEVVSAHVRSLLAGHLMDVASTDRHTVKPWFAGKLNYAPRVEDLAAAGFPLQGGRLDYVGGREVAALIYKYRQHTVNVFTWPGGADSSPKLDSREGFHVLHWTSGGNEWWAVSDLGGPELRQLALLLR